MTCGLLLMFCSCNFLFRSWDLGWLPFFVLSFVRYMTFSFAACTGIYVHHFGTSALRMLYEMVRHKCVLLRLMVVNFLELS